MHRRICVESHLVIDIPTVQFMRLYKVLEDKKRHNIITLFFSIKKKIEFQEFL